MFVAAIEEGLEADRKPCNHQLMGPPEFVANVEGSSYLLFECVLCGCVVSLRLNAKGEIDGEFLFPPARRRA